VLYAGSTFRYKPLIGRSPRKLDRSSWTWTFGVTPQGLRGLEGPGLPGTRRRRELVVLSVIDDEDDARLPITHDRYASLVALERPTFDSLPLSARRRIA
jgi:hypothetical protein